MHDNAHRMSKYTELIDKYDFSSLHFPVPLSSLGSFTNANNMSINVYGVDDDNKAIYLLRVSPAVVPDRHVDLLLFERNGIQHYTIIRNYIRFMVILSIVVSSVYTPTQLRSC